MGCADSIIAATVEYPKQKSPKVNKKNGKVQPAPLRGDKQEREEARARRQRVLAERHAKAQSQAKTISDNAMAEKERLSNSTWKSSRSGVSSILSPAVSISVRGSDGSASPDNFPSPAAAYQDAVGKPSETEVGISDNEHANTMQERTIELPNQVMDETELANQMQNQSELMHSHETSRQNSTNQGSTGGESQVETRHSVTNSMTVVEAKEVNNNALVEQNGVPPTGNATAYSADVDTTHSKQTNEIKDKTETSRKGKSKAKTKHKEVKFVDQLSKVTDTPSEYSRKSITSQGR